jgi:dolichyl-phosphate beta-glucosyltransferase
MCNWFIQRTVVRGVVDTQCGFKAFSAEAAEATFSRATVDGWAFDLEILALADRMSFAIDEVPVMWTDDENSRVNPVRDFVGVVREWMAIRRNLRRDVYGLLPSAASSLC